MENKENKFISFANLLGIDLNSKFNNTDLSELFKKKS